MIGKFCTFPHLPLINLKKKFFFENFIFQKLEMKNAESEIWGIFHGNLFVRRGNVQRFFDHF
jgi:hypothetical protein